MIALKLPKNSERKVASKVQKLVDQLVDEAPDGPAVYFLVRNQTVVYIGGTVNPFDRVKSHRMSKEKAFDLAFYLSVSQVDLAQEEKYWIGVFCPPHNKMHNPNIDNSAKSWGLPFQNGCVLMRVGVYPKEHLAVRILAARSGLPMSQWCERVIREALAKERVFKVGRES